MSVSIYRERNRTSKTACRHRLGKEKVQYLVLEDCLELYEPRRCSQRLMILRNYTRVKSSFVMSPYAPSWRRSKMQHFLCDVLYKQPIVDGGH